MDVQDDILQELQRLKKRVQSLERLESMALLDEDDFSSDSALAAASQQSIYRNVGHYGWIPVGETWSYASSTTVTISGDKTDKYSKGMKVKLTQTSVKYFYITGVSYSSPNTTLTLYAGTDYTVANAAITSPFYSMVANPAGFTHQFNYASTVYGSTGSAGTYAETVEISKFSIVGKNMTLSIEKIINDKGSWSGTVLVDIPMLVNIAGTGSLYINSAVVFPESAYSIKGIGRFVGWAAYMIFEKSPDVSVLAWSDLAVNDHVSICVTVPI
jgi:hypothetical protein